MLESIKTTVISQLKVNNRLRDNDHELMATIWVHEIGKKTVARMTALDFLTLFANSKLTSPESIRRCRQKAQEHDKKLRGKTYGKRKKLQNKVKEQLKKF